jgi:hypothetical protein
MKNLRFAHAFILLVIGSVAVVWGASQLYRALTADPLERVVLENALGGGNAPEYFALRFVACGTILHLLGGLDFRCAARRSGK